MAQTAARYWAATGPLRGCNGLNYCPAIPTSGTQETPRKGRLKAALGGSGQVRASSELPKPTDALLGGPRRVRAPSERPNPPDALPARHSAPWAAPRRSQVRHSTPNPPNALQARPSASERPAGRDQVPTGPYSRQSRVGRRASPRTLRRPLAAPPQNRELPRSARPPP